MQSTEEIRETIEKIESLIGQLKSALQQEESQAHRAPTLCQSSISAIPDWPR